MKFIFRDLPIESLEVAVKAARWIHERKEQKDAILVYGEGDDELALYVKRNRASITIRPCQ